MNSCSGVTGANLVTSRLTWPMTLAAPPASASVTPQGASQHPTTLKVSQEHDNEASVSTLSGTITSDFNRGPENWETLTPGLEALPAATAPFEKAIVLKTIDNQGFFVAPVKYLGDQRASHNQLLTFSLRVGPDASGVRASADDIIIEAGGSTPVQIMLFITDQNNPLPGLDKQKYSFRLHENTQFSWSPQLNSKTFIGLLSNITSIKIRGSFVLNGQTFLDEVQLETATMDGGGKKANWVEYCDCPTGFEGQFCEKCIVGYYHEDNGGSFARCIPCQCNGHSDYCDPEDGVCRCEHNTGGAQCELCAEGYYGDAISGDVNSCQACPCPFVQDEVSGEWRPGMCYEIDGNPESPLCIECPAGRTGSRCEVCEDGFFGDPSGLNGPPRPCQKCDCNNNVDKSAIGNCDRKTGECLRCIDDTAGQHCQTCKDGFYGDALVPRTSANEKNCNPCQCNPLGTYHTDENNDGIPELPICNAYSGKCKCKDNVAGQNCDTCKDGYWDLMSGQGCRDCNCNTEGSYNATCDILTGQCSCRPGVVGAQCDQCQVNHYGFSMDGCRFCDCDITGSTSHQCDLETGQCPCRDKVEGRQCNRCQENTKTKEIEGFEGMEKKCEPCDDCYNLVQDATDEIRTNLHHLADTLDAIAKNPEPVGDKFEVNLRRLQIRIRNMVVDATLNAGGGAGEGVLEKFEALQDELQHVQDVVLNANTQLSTAESQSDQAGQNIGNTEILMARAKEALMRAKKNLDEEGKETLRRAEDMARKMGTGNAKITEVAQLARKLAKEQVEDANEVESIGKQAFEESQNAYSKAMGAMKSQVDNGNEIGKLKSQLKAMESNLADVQSRAASILAAAADSYNEAMQNRILASSLEVPQMSTSGPGSIEDKAKMVIKDAERIRSDGERLIQENENVVREVMDTRAMLEDLLVLSEQQQQQMDARITEMDVHRAEARKAVELGNSVLSQAQDTLQVLQQFDSQVEDNREEFEQMMRGTDDIEMTISKANALTVQADSAISQTGGDTITAFDIANESKEKAEEASNEAQRIVKESQEAKSLAEELRTAAEDMSEKLASTAAIVDEKEGVAARDGQQANDALREANKAQSSSVEASAKVEQAKRELDDITLLLQNIEDPGRT